MRAFRWRDPSQRRSTLKVKLRGAASRPGECDPELECRATTTRLPSRQQTAERDRTQSACGASPAPAACADDAHWLAHAGWREEGGSGQACVPWLRRRGPGSSNRDLFRCGQPSAHLGEPRGAENLGLRAARSSTREERSAGAPAGSAPFQHTLERAGSRRGTVGTDLNKGGRRGAGP